MLFWRNWILFNLRTCQSLTLVFEIGYLQSWSFEIVTKWAILAPNLMLGLDLDLIDTQIFRGWNVNQHRSGEMKLQWFWSKQQHIYSFFISIMLNIISKLANWKGYLEIYKIIIIICNNLVLESRICGPMPIGRHYELCFISLFQVKLLSLYRTGCLSTRVEFTL